MTTIYKKAARILHEDGPITLVKRSFKYGYDTYIRTLLPKRTVSYNGIPVWGSRLGDSIIPWQSRDIPGYESALVNGIQQYVETDDTIVVVGGGWGVSTISAVRECGENGQVITFEGGRQTIERVKETVQLNNDSDQVSIRHAIVGENISLRGDSEGAEEVSASELPECDVLVLDCEGAEIGILEEMEIRPRAVIVETHGLFNSPERKVREKLVEAGYKPENSEIAENRHREFCEENSIYVISSVDIEQNK